jgi:hypothetical protein
MKRNLTLSIEESILDRARVLAATRRTTVNRLVADYLASIVDRDDARGTAANRLQAMMRRPMLNVGGIHWSREELNERPR